jgi:hypothetical protein
MADQPYDIIEENPDGTAVMAVLGVEFLISPQSLPDEEWALKLQAKANLFAETIDP